MIRRVAEREKLASSRASSNKPARGSPPNMRQLDADYVNRAERDVRLQLSRAGIRLASVLNAALGSGETDWNTCLRAGQ